MFILRTTHPDAKTYLSTGMTLSKIGSNSVIAQDHLPSSFARLFYYVGEQGSGKSNELTQHLIDTCLDSSVNNMPIITLIHYGDEQTRLVKAITKAMPEHEPALAIDKMLTNTIDDAINPLDIMLGAHTSYGAYRDNTKNFLISLLTPSENPEPYPNTAGLVEYLIQRVFEVTHGSDATNPKMYKLGANFDVDRAVIAQRVVELLGSMDDNGDGSITMTLRLPTSSAISYTDLTRRLHKAGMNRRAGSSSQKELFRARDIAHTHAMPVLADLLAVLRDMPVTLYTDTDTESGEQLRDYAYRVIEEAVSEFPCFANPTNLNIDKSNVVALNLKQVTGKNHRQNALFLQAARMMAMSRVGYRSCDILDGNIESTYIDYHTNYLGSIANHIKVVAYDGMQIVNGDSRLRELFEVDARERRPLDVNMIFTSTSFSDLSFSNDNYTPTLIQYATDVFVMSEPRGAELEVFKSLLTANDTVLADLKLIDENTFFVYSKPPVGRISTGLVVTKLQPKYSAN